MKTLIYDENLLLKVFFYILIFNVSLSHDKPKKINTHQNKYSCNK